MSGGITIQISEKELKDLDQLHTLARYFCEMTQDSGEQWKEDCKSAEDGFRVLERLWKERSAKQ